MQSRDRVIARHPNLAIIGAHYGSHEADLNALAHRFDRLANFFVDTSARLGDIALLARKDHATTRDFFIRYADRILWGVDWVLTKPASALTDDARAALAHALRSQYELEWRFFTTGEELTINDRPVRGLSLPAGVISKLFVENARRVYPGLAD
jgi:predicted TIM-barrel fold metal-dependent hydrolase